MNFANKAAIITGATGGLGQPVVHRFLQAGIRVAALAQHSNTLDQLMKDANPSHLLTTVTCDVTDSSSIAQALKTIIARFEKIDFLIHIAGGFSGGATVAETPDTLWDHMMQLNLRSTFLMCKAVMPLMAEQNAGKIITISAQAALAPAPKKAAYAVSKAGVIALTQTLAAEGKAHHIQVNSIAPSIILTPKNQKAMPEADKSKWVKPENMAEMMLFLCSPAGDDISGTIIHMPARV